MCVRICVRMRQRLNVRRMIVYISYFWRITFSACESFSKRPFNQFSILLINSIQFDSIKRICIHLISFLSLFDAWAVILSHSLCAVYDFQFLSISQMKKAKWFKIVCVWQHNYRRNIVSTHCEDAVGWLAVGMWRRDKDTFKNMHSSVMHFALSKKSHETARLIVPCGCRDWWIEKRSINKKKKMSRKMHKI